MGIDVKDIADWLIDGARSAPVGTDMMAELCTRLTAAGIPLWRVGLFVRTLHPDIFGRGFVWKPGEPVTVSTVDFDILDTPEFNASPLKIVFREAREVRCRSSDPDSRRFPIVDDMRSEGVTDYLAMPLLFIEGPLARLELDHQATRRLYRRSAGGVAIDRTAFDAADRSDQPSPHRRHAARHLCRQPRRRTDHGRPDQARPRRDDACRDLAVGLARFYRAVRPPAARDGGRHPQSLFRLPGRGDPRPWRRGAQIYGRRTARGVSDRRICRRRPAGLLRAYSKPRANPAVPSTRCITRSGTPSNASASASRCMSAACSTAISAAATGSTSPASDRPSTWRRGWKRSPAGLAARWWPRRVRRHLPRRLERPRRVSDCRLLKSRARLWPDG